MKDIAGSMALILEGGYNLDVLSRCNVKMINALNNISNEKYNEHELKVLGNTKNISNEIKDIFSPFYEF